MDTSRKFYIIYYGEGRFTPKWDKVLKHRDRDSRVDILGVEYVDTPLGKELFEERLHTEDNSIYTSFDFNLLFHGVTDGCTLANASNSSTFNTTFSIEPLDKKYAQGFMIIEHNPSHRRIKFMVTPAGEHLSCASEGDYIDITHRHWFIPSNQAERFQYSLRKRIFSQLSPLSSLLDSELREQVEISMDHFPELSAQFDEALQKPILPMPRFKDENDQEIKTDYGVTLHRSQTFMVDENLLHYAPKFFAVLREDLFLERVFIAYLLQNLSSLVSDEKNCMGLLLDIQLYVELPVMDEMLAETPELDIEVIQEALIGIAEMLKQPYRNLSSLRAQLIEHHTSVLFTHVKRALTQEYMGWLIDFDRYLPGSSFSDEYRDIITSENTTLEDLENLLSRVQYPENVIGFREILQPLQDLVDILKQPITFEIEKADSEQKNTHKQYEQLCGLLETFKQLPSIIAKAEWLTKLYPSISRSPKFNVFFDDLLKNDTLDDTLRGYCLADSLYDKAALLLDSSYHEAIALLFKEMSGMTINAGIASFLKELLFSSESPTRGIKKSVEYLLDLKENKNVEILYQPHHICVIYPETGKFLISYYSSDKKIKAFTLLLQQSTSRQMLTLAFQNDQTIHKAHTLVLGQSKVEHSVRIKEDAQTWVGALREQIKQAPSISSTGVFSVNSPDKKRRSESYSGSPSKTKANL